MELSTCFAYGSLMWPDIMTRVCGREVSALQHTQAWLHGHARHPVRGQDYPGLVPQSGAQALQGVLYTGLTPQDFQRLDAFEGQEYERVPVEVVLEHPATTDGLAPAGAAPAARQKTWVYRYRPEFEHRLEPGDWSPQAFEAQGKARFCARYVGFTQTPAP
ncbi:MAG: gamma-glutamylcyclotransferase family protein [Betaproteobacteria bacterium]